MDWNEHLNLTADFVSCGGSAVGRPTFSVDWRLLLQFLEQLRRVFSLRYMYRITLQNVLLWNRDKYVFCHHQYCSYVTCNCHCHSLCRKNTKLQHDCASGLMHFLKIYEFVNSLKTPYANVWFTFLSSPYIPRHLFPSFYRNFNHYSSGGASPPTSPLRQHQIRVPLLALHTPPSFPVFLPQF